MVLRGEVMVMNRIWAGVAALALLGASCGGSDSTSSTSPPVDEAPPATEAPPDTEAVPVETEAPAPPETNAPVETAAPETTSPPAEPTLPVEPTLPTEPTLPAEPIEFSEPDADGVVNVAVDRDALAPLSNLFSENGGDPFYGVHTTQDDLFIGVELYTVYGDGWTGELGSFPTDCTTHGICIYLDPDGIGPLEVTGPGVGTITVEQLDGETIITIDDVALTAGDGTVYEITGLTLGG